MNNTIEYIILVLSGFIMGCVTIISYNAIKLNIKHRKRTEALSQLIIVDN
jgi:hypothetical protein